jgi:tetratricopeptide (TPR) repeat protein/tRNA A-37 threonylcarbamoyl transferase component Bud32
MKCPLCHFDNPADTYFCGKCGTRLGTTGPPAASMTMTMTTPVPDLQRGKLFAGRYEVIEPLGRGGMGSVYRVEDKKVNEEIALKLINPEIAQDRKIIDRFSHELKVARQISHRNVCRMYDFGEAEGSHFITMEYVQGEDLRSLLKRIGRLPEDKALSIAKQVADGLAEAHHLGIVHRDLKPGNIMVDREGNAKIMDFGIARSVKSKVITATGLIIGTPDYMSLEQAEAKEVDARSDIYTLGVILYEMTTGRVPFEGETALAVAMKHKSEKPTDPRELNPQISAPASGLILKCLEKEKEKRFQTAAELRTAIAAIGGTVTPAPRSGTLRKTMPSKEITVTFKLKKVLLPVIAVIALAAAGVVLWRVASKPTPATRSVAVIHFQNQTGDVAFDYLRNAIPNLLITSLEQSKYLQVTTLERLRDLLRQAGKADVETIDGDLGFELCRQDNVETLVLGSYVKAGETFATDVKIFDVRSRKLMKSFTAQGAGAQSILEKQIAQLSREISRGVGLSRKAVDETGEAMAQVPTKSMEAYKYYLEGRVKYDQMFFDDARKDFEKALAIDPECAIAHLFLAGVYQRLGNMAATYESLKKAKEFSSRSTEKDRLLIESQYAFRVEQDTEKRFRLLQELVTRFPKEKENYSPLVSYYVTQRMYPEALAVAEKALALDPKWAVMLNHLGFIYEFLGDTAKAIETLEKAIVAVPNEPNLFDSLGELYANSGRLDEAIECCKKAIALKPDFGSEEFIAYLRSVQGNYADSLTWIDQFILMAPNNENKGRGYWWKAIFDHLSGRRDQAAREMDRVRTLTESLGNMYGTAMAAYGRAFLHFDRGEYDPALASLEEGHRIALAMAAKMTPAALTMVTKTPAVQTSFEALCDFERYLMQGYIAVRRGQTEAARRSVSSLEAALPKFLAQKTARGPQLEQSFNNLRAEVLLLEGKPAEAIAVIEREFKLTIPSYGPPNFPFNYFVLNFPLDQDVVPKAYEKMGNPDKAIEAYRKLVDFDPKVPDRRMHNPRYHYRLGKLYESKGQNDLAKAEYQKLLEIWKDADPGIPELVDAKKRLAALR